MHEDWVAVDPIRDPRFLLIQLRNYAALLNRKQFHLSMHGHN